jgi:O-methyltransferase
VKRTLQKFLRIFGLRVSRIQSKNNWHSQSSPDILHSIIEPLATYSPWLMDVQFMNTYRVAEKNTLIDIYRCYELFSLAKQTSHLNGSYLEVGVWRGGSAFVISQAIAGQHHLYLADTFHGVAKTTANDTSYKDGDHSDTSKNLVENYLLKRQVSNFTIIEGVFPESGFDKLKRESFSFVHIDVDVYQSVRESMDFLSSRILKGGIVILDDCGFYGCEGVTRYVEEHMLSNVFTTIYNLNGHAILIKN